MSFLEKGLFLMTCVDRSRRSLGLFTDLPVMIMVLKDFEIILIVMWKHNKMIECLGVL